MKNLRKLTLLCADDDNDVESGRGKNRRPAGRFREH